MLLFPVLVADLLYVPPSVGEPVVELSLCHVCVEGQALLVGLGRLRIERMLLNPADKDSRVPRQPLSHGERAARARSGVRAGTAGCHWVVRARRRLRKVVAGR